MPDISLITNVVFIIAFVLTLVLSIFVKKVSIGRRQVVILAAAWVLIVTLQYWILGPASYVYAGDDGTQPIVNFLHWNRFFDGGPFLHGPMGGADARAMMAGSGSLVSLERTLLAFLPLWVAIFLQKSLVGLVAMSGAYVMARRCGGASRGVSLILACFYSVSHHYMTVATFHPALGYPLIPWFIYAIVGRINDRPLKYYGLILALSCLHAISTIPTHILMATVPAILLAALALGVWRPGRIALALVLLLLPIVLNWHQGLIALAEIAPLTGRVQFYATEHTLIPALSAALPPWGYAFTGLLVIVPFTLALVARGEPGRYRSAAAALGGIILGPLLLLFPWHALGLGAFAAIDYSYVKFALPPLATLIAAQALARRPGTPPLSSRWASLGGAAVAALAVGLMAQQKTQDVCYWIGDGGQKNLTAIPNLVDRPWAPDGDFRVVTIPFRLRHNYMLAYGLDTLDGQLNAISAAYYRYWTSMVPGARLTRSGTGILTPPGFDPMCCESHDFDSLANVDLLRQANVGFVISAVPLTGRSLHQVSGPSGAANPFLRAQPLATKLATYLSRVIDPGPVFVYAIGTPTPRVFGAAGVETVPDDLENADFLGRVAAHVDDRVVVARAGVTPRNLPEARLEVRRYTKSGRGFSVSVSAPQGGVLVINTAYLPFWSAWAEGKELAIFPVNEIQTGIVVPAGIETVNVLYKRSP